MEKETNCPRCRTGFTAIVGELPLRCPVDGTPLREDLIEEFVAWLREDRGLSENTQYRYRYALRAVVGYLTAQGVTLRDANTQALQLALRKTPRKPSTRNNYRSVVRTFYGWLAMSGGRADNPALALAGVKEARGLPNPFEGHEYALYMKAAKELGRKHRALGALGMYAGLRISEAASLPWASIGVELRVIGKGRKERRIPILAPLREALDEWRTLCPPGPWVFPSARGPNARRGECIRRQHAAKMHRQILEAAGLPPREYGYHRLRHTFATEALSRSGNLRAVQELLGHSSPATTAIYTFVSSKQLAEVVAAMYPDLSVGKERRPDAWNTRRRGRGHTLRRRRGGLRSLGLRTR